VGAEAAVPSSSGKGEGRIVVYGDSDFTSNFFIDHLGNKDLAVNTINWLAEDIERMGARPASQEPGRHQFFMSAGQGRRALLLSTLVMPAVPLAIGVGFFIRRRRET
jgi:ABC-type uncharacterized transport system involved in gliding motility auxiliary subunit